MRRMSGVEVYLNVLERIDIERGSMLQDIALLSRDRIYIVPRLLYMRLVYRVGSRYFITPMSDTQRLRIINRHLALVNSGQLSTMEMQVIKDGIRHNCELAFPS